MYNFFWNWRTQNKVLPNESITGGTFISNIILSKDYSNKKYYGLCKKIRNFESLSLKELLYLNELSQENLIEIIVMYNKHAKNIKNILIQKMFDIIFTLFPIIDIFQGCQYCNKMCI